MRCHPFMFVLHASHLSMLNAIFLDLWVSLEARKALVTKAGKIRQLKNLNERHKRGTPFLVRLLVSFLLRWDR